MLLNNIDATYYFVLDKRWQNWLDIKDQLYSLNLKNLKPFVSGGSNVGGLRYDRVDTVRPPPSYPNSTNYPTWHTRFNAYNIWLSHRMVLEECQKLGYKTIMFLEDDIMIEDDFSKLLDNAEKYLYNKSWDMLYLGGYHNSNSFSETENPNIIRLNGSGGWHGVILKDKVINELLSFPAIGPYDWICGQYIHTIFSCYAIYPSIISQFSGHSEVEGGHLNKPSRYQK
jgi:hypothetical protein